MPLVDVGGHEAFETAFTAAVPYLLRLDVWPEDMNQLKNDTPRSAST